MKKYGKRDANSSEIVKALKRVGVKVVDLQDLGDDKPDLLCTFRGKTQFLEIKSPQNGLTAGQTRFYLEWTAAGGKYAIVHSVQEALEAFGLARSGPLSA